MVNHIGDFWGIFTGHKDILGHSGAFIGPPKVPNGPNTERPIGHMACTPDGQSAPESLYFV